MREADWRELAVALAAALVHSESSEPESLELETLSRARASRMHAELGRLGLSREEHYSVAETTLEREVKSLTSLTEPEALTVLNAARKLASERTAPPVSDEEAQRLLS